MAVNYLNQLMTDGVLVKYRWMRANYYINEPLFALMAREYAKRRPDV